MKFATIRDLRTKTATLRKELKKEREIVLTANGRPFAIMLPTDQKRLDDDLLEIRRSRARRALKAIQDHAKQLGLDRMTMDEIDAIIAQVRRERRAEQ